MAAACEIRRLEDPKEVASLGVKYQLMSRFTNFLAIDVKAANEKAVDLPALRKTPQMLAAGWGGSGSDSAGNELGLYAETDVFGAPLDDNFRT